MVAEQLQRKWISCDVEKKYVAASVFRFTDNIEEGKLFYDYIMNDKSARIVDSNKSH